MENIRILKYSTNKWLTKENEVMEALRDILINGNRHGYSYNPSMAERTVEYFKIKL